MILFAYRAFGQLVAPLVGLMLERRAAQGKEDRARLPERLGRAGQTRPEGRLVWIHGASVGEVLSVLPLVARLLERRSDLSVLLTSGTVTSAQILAERLPPRALHQFVPIDLPAAVVRFLDHWRPDAAVWVESELWPNLILDTAARGVPMALVQGRMSARSKRGWSRAPRTARRLLGAFRLCLAQSVADADRFAALGAPAPRSVGNLKFAAQPLPVDEAELARLRAAIGRRPVWIAASTHDPEEQAMAAAHRLLTARWPDLLTVVVPRHPARGEAVAQLLGGAPLRSRGETPGGCYVADTMGELGLFYRLAQVAFVGGSLIPHGGQNPLEPARLGLPVLHGPSMFNFTDAVEALAAVGASRTVNDAAELAEAVAALLADAEGCRQRGAAARKVADSGEEALDAVAEALLPLIPA